MIGITTAGVIGVKDALQDLKSAGVQLIDCSVTSLLETSSISEVDLDDVRRLGERLSLYEMKCNSLQSIFYGMHEAHLNEKNIKEHLSKCFDMLEALSCESILFGSPQQRKDSISASRLIHLMDKIAQNRNKNVLIENLDLYHGVWGRTARDIQQEIARNNFASCSINLHVFVEDTLDIEGLEIERVKCIHLSNKNYSADLKDVNRETLEKVKAVYQKVSRLCLEFVNCSAYDCLREFQSFKKKWENL